MYAFQPLYTKFIYIYIVPGILIYYYIYSRTKIELETDKNVHARISMHALMMYQQIKNKTKTKKNWEMKNELGSKKNFIILFTTKNTHTSLKKKIHYCINAPYISQTKHTSTSYNIDNDNIFPTCCHHMRFNDIFVIVIYAILCVCGPIILLPFASIHCLRLKADFSQCDVHEHTRMSLMRNH